MTIEELRKIIQEYCERGYSEAVAAAAREAQKATKQFIMSTHPRSAFGGKNLINDEKNGQGIVIGSFDIRSAGVIHANIYANYFARWYNTGAFGRIIRSGVRKGQRGPLYSARGAYFEQNSKAIEQYYADYIVNYLQEHIEL